MALNGGGAFFQKQGELLNTSTPCFIAEFSDTDNSVSALACLSKARQWTMPLSAISRVEVKDSFVGRGVHKTPVAACPWQCGGGSAIIDMDVDLPIGWLNSLMGSNGGTYHVGLKVTDVDGWMAALSKGGAKGVVGRGGSPPSSHEMVR